MGNHPEPKEGGIGVLLTTRHALHAKTDLEFFDSIFRVLPALAIPDQHLGSRTRPIAGNDVEARMLAFQQIRMLG